MRLLVRGGTVFDPRSGTASSADVVIEGERVVDVGVDLDGDRDIDASGCLVVPGFIDCHVHVTIDEIDVLGMIQQPFSLRFFRAVRNLSRTLRAGVTTVRDAAGADLGVKQAVASGLITEPDLHIAIGMLSQTGGHADEWMASGGCVHALWTPHPGAPATVIDGVDEIRRAVRQLVRAGADVIDQSVRRIQPDDKAPGQTIATLQDQQLDQSQDHPSRPWIRALTPDPPSSFD